MRPRLNLLIATVVVALCLGRGAAGWAGEDATYPIWWSPSLELESLDKIDERLGEPLYSSGSGFTLYDADRGNRTEAIADSCKSLDRLLDEGYSAFLMHRIRFLLVVMAKCHAIEMLGEAQPAKKSHVRDFKLDADSIEYLPAMANLSPSCDFRCRQYVANERRISWKKFEPRGILSVDAKSEYQMEVKTPGVDLKMEIVARGDFNRDGLEDLLLKVIAGATGGTWGWTELSLLSRESPDGVLWMLDAEQGLCRRYECEVEYDYPEALRRTN